MRIPALVVSLLLGITVLASGQTVERRIDLTALGWGLLSAHEVDTDGNIATEEWAVEGLDGLFGTHGLWRVVAVRQGELCIGDWFDPIPASAEWNSDVQLSTTGRTAKLMVTQLTFPDGWLPRQTVIVVRLDTPRCQ